jgi:hypothetical protein
VGGNSFIVGGVGDLGPFGVWIGRLGDCLFALLVFQYLIQRV